MLLKLGAHTLSLQDPAPYWLCCNDETARERWLDHCCQLLQQAHVSYGLLTLQAALISNLTVAENLLLTATWQQPRPTKDLLTAAGELFGLLGFADANRHILPQRPNALNAEQWRAAVIVRAMLAKPLVLVGDRRWFAGCHWREEQVLMHAQPLWPRCCWLMFSEQQTPPAGSDWQVLELAEMPEGVLA